MKHAAPILLLFALLIAPPAVAQTPQPGAIEGTVSIASTGDRLHNAIVLLPQLGRRTETTDEGTFRFANVPPGTYSIVARAQALGDQRLTVRVAAGQVAQVEFMLPLGSVPQQITVTASGREQTASESFQAVTTLESTDLVQESHPSLGEVLENQPGIAKRSFGPGSARPVLRGFDGDRVLVMKDGTPTGSVSSQSGDHGEPMDVLGLERLEVVKGPATLLYGSSAIGGVVNAVTPFEHAAEHGHQGLTGYASALGGTNNGHAGGGTGFEFGMRDWLLFANVNSQRTGNYSSPLGEIENSGTRTAETNTGLGWFGKKSFLSGGFGYVNSRYGIPFAALLGGHGHEDDQVDIRMRRYNGRLSGGLRELNGPIEDLRLTLDVNDYRHQELEIAEGVEEVGTTFRNRLLSYRATATQRRTGKLSGTLGFSGSVRRYRTAGEEALAPPVDHNSFSVFALEQLDFERVGFQFGGRVETNRYDAYGAQAREFTGFSGAGGVRVPLWTGGTFVANYTHSYRAPALEELYNNGPHVGNLTFEIGNPNLVGERSNGLDLSLRHGGERLRLEANFFQYHISDFVFLSPTGNMEDGLIEAEYLQANSRFVGGEATLDVQLHPLLWMNLGLDVVNAELLQNVSSVSTGAMASADTPLPRIPPLRGRAGLDLRWRGLRVQPQVLMTAAQEDIFPTETRTAGHTVLNTEASYTWAKGHFVHVLSLNAFNLTDRVYRNHLSFIKELAPEIGRGVRFGYTLRFF